MEEEKIAQRLFTYNLIFKENDDIYHNAAKKLGLSDSAFWILYTLREMTSSPTQSQLSNMQFFPKQTIHSALKKLESEGYVELLSGSNHKNKQLHLTQKGEELVCQTIDLVLQAEKKTWAAFCDEEQEAFLRLFRQYTDALHQNMKALLPPE
ncbi:MAG: MarR family transcriptional regulator [bacterium]|nr:MarR family transcriptional regulator [bacterium]